MVPQSAYVAPPERVHGIREGAAVMIRDPYLHGAVEVLTARPDPPAVSPPVDLARPPPDLPPVPLIPTRSGT